MRTAGRTWERSPLFAGWTTFPVTSAQCVEGNWLEGKDSEPTLNAKSVDGAEKMPLRIFQVLALLYVFISLVNFFARDIPWEVMIVIGLVLLLLALLFTKRR